MIMYGLRIVLFTLTVIIVLITTS